MNIDFIKWMCDKAEGFEVVGDCLEIRNIYSIRFSQIEGDNCISFTNMVYRLLLQEALEWINRESIYYSISQDFSSIDVITNGGILISIDIKNKNNEYQAKESALKYIYEQETK
jgi:hypothetical protein